MTALLFGLLLLPACATVTGLVIWAINRGHALGDGELLRQFMIVWVICAAFFWWGMGTNAVRLRIDPQFRLQTELDAHPLYATFKRLAHDDDSKQLHGFLVLQMSRGATLADAFLQARPLLTRLTNERIGFTDQKARLAWGRVAVDTLRELKARDSLLCYRSLSAQALDQQTLALAFSADNTRAFQQAVIQVYEAAATDINKPRPGDEQRVEFNAAALEYSVIRDRIAQKFGESVSNQLAKRNFPEPPIQPPEQMCAARIYQLEAMLERPQAMASRLLDSVLR